MLFFFFYLCYTKGKWLPLPLIKIALFHTTCHYLLLFCYYVFLCKTCCFSFTLSARKLACENRVVVPDQIQQLFFMESSFQGHTLNTPNQESWTFPVKTWKILAALLNKHPLPKQKSLSFLLFHPALLQVAKLKQKGRCWLFMQFLHAYVLWPIALLLYKQLGKESITQLEGKTWLNNKGISNIFFVDSPYIPPEGYRTPKILKNKFSNLPKVNCVLNVISKFLWG